ncbi:hypothetical protein PFUGPA_02990 [Plasmodium falciparum Palo Alto/Uganda]|uniref:Uncharacterized protein n=1 Tax=Plasmodium falciparum (isolate Palo Alto / Uganda) TaxID=57270 RepID=W4IYV3_PLAFP|nr:hypothetical protein PFUGPA_02990 [Plasmodium falciparum Palo Alto/Uganda]
MEKTRDGKYKWRQINGLFIYILYNCNFSLKFYKYKCILCDNTKCDSLKSILFFQCVSKKIKK